MSGKETNTSGGGFQYVRRAFTLIELLVVIAVIAILASLLLPALAASKKQAIKTQCVNNQHEIALAMQMYVDDARDSYPAYYDWATWGGGTGTNIGMASDVPGVESAWRRFQPNQSPALSLSQDRQYLSMSGRYRRSLICCRI